MINYVVNMATYELLETEIVARILNCDSIQNALFPAFLPVSPTITKRLANPREFSLDLIPADFKTESNIRLPLISENNIEFNINLHLRHTVVPNIINIEFSSEHLENGILTSGKIMKIFTEVIPIFDVFDGMLYDAYSKKIYRPDGGFGFEKPKRFRNIRLDLGWINYFGKKAVDILGRNRFSRLKSCAQMYDLHGGFLIMLQEKPFDKQNSEHIFRKEQAQRELGFDELSKYNR